MEGDEAVVVREEGLAELLAGTVELISLGQQYIKVADLEAKKGLVALYFTGQGLYEFAEVKQRFLEIRAAGKIFDIIVVVSGLGELRFEQPDVPRDWLFIPLSESEKTWKVWNDNLAGHGYIPYFVIHDCEKSQTYVRHHFHNPILRYIIGYGGLTAYPFDPESINKFEKEMEEEKTRLSLTDSLKIPLHNCALDLVRGYKAGKYTCVICKNPGWGGWTYSCEALMDDYGNYPSCWQPEIGVFKAHAECALKHK